LAGLLREGGYRAQHQ